MSNPFDPFDGLGEPVMAGHVMVFGDEGDGQHARTRCVRWVEWLREHDILAYEKLAAAHYWKGSISLAWFPGTTECECVTRLCSTGGVHEWTTVNGELVSMDWWSIINSDEIFGYAACCMWARLTDEQALHERRVSYREYIQSAEWRAKAEAAKARAGQRCQACNRHRGEVQLDAHHRTYERLGHELPEDIFVMCEDCHAVITREIKRRKQAA